MDKITIPAPIYESHLQLIISKPTLEEALIVFQTAIGVDGGFASIFFGDTDDAQWALDPAPYTWRRSRFLEYAQCELESTIYYGIEAQLKRSS